MSDIEKSAMPIVCAFDGVHRSGKGAQTDLLNNLLKSHGYRSVILRGDGNRSGLGISEGDPYSIEWQERKKRLHSGDATWRNTSVRLMEELTEIKLRSPSTYDVLILDRSLLSRVAYVLENEAMGAHAELTYEQMYGEVSSAVRENLLADIIFNLEPSNISVPLARVALGSPDYHKYCEKINRRFWYHIIAPNYVTRDVRERIVTLSADKSPVEIHKEVVQHMCGRLGLNLCTTLPGPTKMSSTTET